jgi:hypothetical protein
VIQHETFKYLFKHLSTYLRHIQRLIARISKITKFKVPLIQEYQRDRLQTIIQNEKDETLEGVIGFYSMYAHLLLYLPSCSQEMLLRGVDHSHLLDS